MKSFRFIDATQGRGAWGTDFSWTPPFSELKDQRRMAQRGGEYEKWVRFLKQSDERTRLATFVEMLIGKLDCKSASANDHDWVAEHKRWLSIFYQHPDLPEECRANGTLTGNIKTLVVSRLKAEKEGVENEIIETEAAKGGSIRQYFCRIAPSTEDMERQNRLKSLVERRASITGELRLLLDHSSPKATSEPNHTIAESVSRWVSAVRNACVKNFFGQRLHVEEEFVRRLKLALNEIQKAFPICCRTEVSDLRREYIESTYKTLLEAVADAICSQTERSKSFRSVLIPSLLPKFTFEGMLKDPRGYRKVEKLLLRNGVLLSTEVDERSRKAEKLMLYHMLMIGPSALNTRQMIDAPAAPGKWPAPDHGTGCPRGAGLEAASGPIMRY
jgi:hypothetical protein